MVWGVGWLRRILSSSLLIVVAALIPLFAPPAIAGSTSSTDCTVYIVQPGDWLSTISPRYNVSWHDLATENNLTNPDLIYPGQRIEICTSATQTSDPIAVDRPATETGEPVAIYHDASFPNYGVPGQCVWYVAAVRSDLDLRGIGAAKDITAAMSQRGYATGTTPAVGALVVYQPNVQGADPVYGHVAIVWQILSNGHFVIREMNRKAVPSLDGTPGGLWKVDEWVSWTGPGVSFVYG